MKFSMKLNGITEGYRLVPILKKADFDINIISGNQSIDGKSVLGMFTLKMPASIKVECITEDKEAVDKIISAVEEEFGAEIRRLE